MVHRATIGLVLILVWIAILFHLFEQSSAARNHVRFLALSPSPSQVPVPASPQSPHFA
ncbi:unnamed protein product [Coffea canephora]|uniref:Uncharacterized protein n=1 Tax=Coffea canephora TaxID=49390 RepID=A0A068TWA5_COFCA|nr:unnamed protein product [Coffea canephora]